MLSTALTSWQTLFYRTLTCLWGQTQVLPLLEVLRRKLVGLQFRCLESIQPIQDLIPLGIEGMGML